MNEGHKEQDAAGKDPFGMSDEEFQKARTEMLSGEAAADDTDNGDTEGSDAEKSSDEEAAPADDTVSQEEVTEEAPIKPFKLEEETPKQEDGAEAPEIHEIIHKGQVHRITKEKLLELAQKGFDYDAKVGPHARLVQLVEADRGAQEALNEYLRAKYGSPQQQQQQPERPKLKPLAEYDDEIKWLEDNVKALIPPTPQPVRQQQQVNPVQVLHAAIQTHDPTGAAEIIPILANEAQQLTYADNQRIEAAAAQGDLRPFFKFYDYVKEKISTQKRTAQPPVGKPQFRMKTGGGDPPRATDKTTNAWDMPAKDFQAYIAKIKNGYA